MVLRFWDSLTISQKQAFVAWLFLSIPILFYLIIRFYPTFEAFYVSTVKWNILGNKKFIGINNFVKIINNEEFWIVLSNTVKYAVTEYTELITHIINIIDSNQILMPDGIIGSEYKALTNLVKIKEEAGIERAMGAAGFAKEVFLKKTLHI